MITVIRVETTEEERRKIRTCMGKRGGAASRKEVHKFVMDAYDAALNGADAQQMEDEDDDTPPRKTLKVKAKKARR